MMVYVDILAAFFATVAWTGNLVLILLFQRQVAGMRIFHRYIVWKFIAWSWLIGVQIVTFIHEDSAPQATTGFYAVFFAARMLGFRALMGLATWILVYDILRPRKVVAIPRPEAQIQMNAQGTIVGWNSEAERLFGWSSSEAVGQELAALVVPESMRNAHRAGVQRYRETGQAPLIDSRYTQLACRKDGSTFLIDVSLTAHLTSQGTIFLGTCAPAVVVG